MTGVHAIFFLRGRALLVALGVVVVAFLYAVMCVRTPTVVADDAALAGASTVAWKQPLEAAQEHDAADAPPTALHVETWHEAVPADLAHGVSVQAPAASIAAFMARQTTAGTSSRVMITWPVVDAKVRAVHANVLAVVDRYLARGNDDHDGPLIAWLLDLRETLAATPPTEARTEVLARIDYALACLADRPLESATRERMERFLATVPEHAQAQGMHAGNPLLTRLWRGRTALALPLAGDEATLVWQALSPAADPANADRAETYRRLYAVETTLLREPPNRERMLIAHLRAAAPPAMVGLFPLRPALSPTPAVVAGWLLPSALLGPGTPSNAVVPTLCEALWENDPTVLQAWDDLVMAGSPGEAAGGWLSARGLAAAVQLPLPTVLRRPEHFPASLPGIATDTALQQIVLAGNPRPLSLISRGFWTTWGADTPASTATDTPMRRLAVDSAALWLEASAVSRINAALATHVGSDITAGLRYFQPGEAGEAVTVAQALTRLEALLWGLVSLSQDDLPGSPAATPFTAEQLRDARLFAGSWLGAIGTDSDLAFALPTVAPVKRLSDNRVLAELDFGVGGEVVRVTWDAEPVPMIWPMAVRVTTHLGGVGELTLPADLSRSTWQQLCAMGFSPTLLTDTAR